MTAETRPPDQFLTTEEALAYLGIKSADLDRMLKEFGIGRYRTYEPGRAIVFAKRDLERLKRAIPPPPPPKEPPAATTEAPVKKEAPARAEAAESAAETAAAKAEAAPAAKAAVEATPADGETAEGDAETEQHPNRAEA
jgi:hypothetical protein